MGEHIPWADRFSGEVDAFFRLWKNRRWLARSTLQRNSSFSAGATHSLSGSFLMAVRTIDEQRGREVFYQNDSKDNP